MNYPVFIVALLICTFGAFGVVWFRNPVHSALSLVATLFAMAMVVAPTVFSTLVALTGSYVSGFLACAILALAGAAALAIVPAPAEGRGRFVAGK